MTSHNEILRDYVKSHPEEKHSVIAKYFGITEKWLYMVLRGEEYLSNLRQHYTDKRLKIKTEILTHYGNGKCACVKCGENRIDCLSIDHINGDGCKEREKHNRWGCTFYSKLKRENYPSGFQTLCMNCQFCKMILDKAMNKDRQWKKER